VLQARFAAYEELEHQASGRPILLGSAATKLAWLGVRPNVMAAYDPRAVNGSVVRLRDIAALVQVAELAPEAARRLVDPRHPESSEFETVLAGLVGIEAFLRRESKDEFTVCAHGTRYGLAWSLALAPPRGAGRSKAKRAPAP
jgi:hypothetical protein